MALLLQTARRALSHHSHRLIQLSTPFSCLLCHTHADTWLDSNMSRAEDTTSMCCLLLLRCIACGRANIYRAGGTRQACAACCY